MKHSKRYMFIVLLLMFLTIFAYADSHKKISISVLSFAPLHSIDSDTNLFEEQPGYAIEIYQKIYGDAGYTVDFKKFPFNRGMIEVSQGRIDAISGPLKFNQNELKNKIRQMPLIGPLYGELIYPLKTIGIHHSSCVFVRSDSEWEYTGPGSLDGKKIGTALNYDYGEEMNSYLEKRLIEDKNSVTQLTGNSVFLQNLQKLVLNRVDAVLMDRVSGNFAIKSAVDQGILEPDSVRLSGCSGIPAYLYLAFSGRNTEKSQELADIFDKGIKELRESGELEIILDKYGIKDWYSDQY